MLQNTVSSREGGLTYDDGLENYFKVDDLNVWRN